MGSKKPVAFLSILLDPVARGWPVCVQAILAVALLVEEAQKLTFSGTLAIHTPHAIRSLLNQKAEKWLPDSRMLKYETMLLETPNLTMSTSSHVNPAQFLYEEPERKVIHDCLELIDYQTKIWEDLMESELPDGEKLFIDGSSRCQQGQRMSGYAVVDGRTMGLKEKGKLPSHWSAQSCE